MICGIACIRDLHCYFRFWRSRICIKNTIFTYRGETVLTAMWRVHGGLSRIEYNRSWRTFVSILSRTRRALPLRASDGPQLALSAHDDANVFNVWRAASGAFPT